MVNFPEQYGPWAVVNGASDGVGAAFAEELARRDVNAVLVDRRRPLLEELAGRLDIETRIVPLDLSRADAITEHLGPLAAPSDVARTGLDHLADGPVWNFTSHDPTGPSPLGALPRRQAAELMSLGSAAMFATRR